MAVPSSCGMLGKKSSGHFTGSRAFFAIYCVPLNGCYVQLSLAESCVDFCDFGLHLCENAVTTLFPAWKARNHLDSRAAPGSTSGALAPDAERWLEQHPLCLYLPRRAQLTAPAPSFVEACMGSAQAMPGAAAIDQAQGWLTRLAATGSVVALNLLGAVSEQPDFLAHRQALPYVVCLRADADWKHAPQKSSGHKVSPLVLELWKALDKEGVLSAAQARETLGRELTEAAVLRGLSELWQGLRINPVYGNAGQPAQWELLRVRHREALATAAGTSQVTALSLLVSMYLQSVYAASSDEIEIFLSPVASRSRVREAVRGLAATRQIHSLSMDAQTYYFLEDGLPEFGAPAGPPAESPTEKIELPGPVAPAMARAGTSPPLPAQRRDRDRLPRPERPAAPLGRSVRPAPLTPKPVTP